MRLLPLFLRSLTGAVTIADVYQLHESRTAPQLAKRELSLHPEAIIPVSSRVHSLRQVLMGPWSTLQHKLIPGESNR